MFHILLLYGTGLRIYVIKYSRECLAFDLLATTSLLDEWWQFIFTSLSACCCHMTIVYGFLVELWAQRDLHCIINIESFLIFFHWWYIDITTPEKVHYVFQPLVLQVVLVEHHNVLLACIDIDLLRSAFLHRILHILRNCREHEPIVLIGIEFQLYTIESFEEDACTEGFLGFFAVVREHLYLPELIEWL